MRPRGGQAPERHGVFPVRLRGTNITAPRAAPVHRRGGILRLLENGALTSGARKWISSSGWRFAADNQSVPHHAPTLEET